MRALLEIQASQANLLSEIRGSCTEQADIRAEVSQIWTVVWAHDEASEEGHAKMEAVTKAVELINDSISFLKEDAVEDRANIEFLPEAQVEGDEKHEELIEEVWLLKERCDACDKMMRAQNEMIKALQESLNQNPAWDVKNLNKTQLIALAPHTAGN